MEHNKTGAIGALLDEYQKSITELQHLIKHVGNEELKLIVDPKTQNPDCRSIQTILTHVVSSAFSYAVYIAEYNHEGGFKRQKTERSSVSEYIVDLNMGFDFTCLIFQKYDDRDIEECDDALKIKSRWGQTYDIEQMMEHAIVHILRHRRQIESFMKKIQEAS